MTREGGPPAGRLLADLRERVDARYRSGEYPPDLETELSRRFQAIVASRPSLGELARARGPADGAGGA